MRAGAARAEVGAGTIAQGHNAGSAGRGSAPGLIGGQLALALSREGGVAAGVATAADGGGAQGRVGELFVSKGLLGRRQAAPRDVAAHHAPAQAPPDARRTGRQGRPGA